MKDRILLFFMKLMPTHLLSRWAGTFAESSLSKSLIPLFANHFGISVEEAEKPLAEYRSLNDFFTRRLTAESRPISTDPKAVVSPADGKIAAFGKIDEGKLLQAKGVYYFVWELLGMKKEDARKYEGGSFITIYLSPRDYHRIHSPISGTITDYAYLPGTLFPVNAFGVRVVEGLFSKNERLISFIESPAGRVGVAKVGATMVGSVKVIYSDTASTNIPKGKMEKLKLDTPVSIDKGNEIGYFRFGSTVVLVFEKDTIEFLPELREGEMVKMGEKIATFS